MDDPKSVIQDIISDEPPITVPFQPLMQGDMGQIMRKIERERKRSEHDANIRENYTFCRKKCKLFKKCQCFKKSFDEQKDCADSGKYLELAKTTVEDVTNVEIAK